MARGRHTTRRNPAFLRDLSIMAVGTLVVAALVFGALWVLTSLGDDDTEVAATTTTEASPSSTSTSTSVPSSTTTTTPSTTTSAPSTTTTVTVRAPADIRVLVLNAKGVQGLAAGVTEELGALGYQMLEPDNHPSLDRSRVWYREGFGAEALDLSASFPDALVEFSPDVGVEWDADIVVVLGASYEG
jgi:hypothetical protein